MAAYAIAALAMAATCYAIDPMAPVSTNLTIGLIAQNQRDQLAACDISNAPSIHFTGITNSSSITVGIEIFTNSSYSLNNLDGTLISVNYTVSNADKYSNDTVYSGLYYEQTGGDINTLGILQVATFPCPNGATSCTGEGVNGLDYTTGSNVTVGQNEKLVWNCNAPAACYQVPYDIKGFDVGTSVYTNENISLVESDGQCLLEAVMDASNSSVITNHNDLPKNGASAASSSFAVIGLSIGTLAASMLLWT